MSSGEPDENIESQNELDNGEKPFLRVIVHSFFIIPFLIAVFCALLFGALHLLTSEKRTVYDYLEDVKIGGLNKRWQGAFELSKILNNPQLVPDDQRFINELEAAFKQSAHDDNRVRQYLALAMGRTGNKVFAPLLVLALEDGKEENLAAIIYSIGMLKDQETAAALYPYVEHQSARIRSMAVVSLGNIKSKSSIDIIKKGLHDSEPNVQWGSAISLAKMGDATGKNIISKLLDRSYLSQFEHVDQKEQNQLILTALSATKKISDQGLDDQIRQLSTDDPNMKIRSAALSLLNN